MFVAFLQQLDCAFCTKRLSAKRCFLTAGNLSSSPRPRTPSWSSRRSPSPRFPQSNSTQKRPKLHPPSCSLSAKRGFLTAVKISFLLLSHEPFSRTSRQALLSDGRMEQCCSTLIGGPHDLLYHSGGRPRAFCTRTEGSLRPQPEG